MESLTFITYSHSEYSDIWPLILDGMNKIPKSLNRIFACNTNSVDMTDIYNTYDKVVLYNDTLSYPQKLLYILSYVTTPYVLLIHDIDICIKLEASKLESLMYAIISNKIDRCILGMIPKQSLLIEVDTMLLTNASNIGISNCFYTPYDVGVSIYDAQVLRTAMTLFNSVSYRDIEFCGIQDYFKSKNVWAFTPSESCIPIFQIGRPYSNYFTFIHILIRGKWLENKYYMDLEYEFAELINKHMIDINIRGIIDSSHIDIHKRRV
jgi:hypothetical protein